MEGIAICQCDDGLHFDDLPCRGKEMNFLFSSSSSSQLFINFILKIHVEIKHVLLVCVQEKPMRLTKLFVHVLSIEKGIHVNIQTVRSI